MLKVRNKSKEKSENILTRFVIPILKVTKFLFHIFFLYFDNTVATYNTVFIFHEGRVAKDTILSTLKITVKNLYIWDSTEKHKMECLFSEFEKDCVTNKSKKL